MAKEILIVTGKFPDISNDTDGGSILVNHLIYMLRHHFVIDILFTRSINEKYKKIDGIRNVFFHTKKVSCNDKFSRRLANTQWNKEEIERLSYKYDKTLIIHCSKAFGIESFNPILLDKIVLFPMFLTSAYRRAGEYVPLEYYEAEKRVLTQIKTIITPSIIEKEDIIKDYSANEAKIKVIPRATNIFVNGKKRVKSLNNNIIYISSIKKQKSPEDAILLVQLLKQKGINCHLHIVGSLQDNDIYNNCIKLIIKYSLQNQVSYHGVVSQQILAKLLEQMDINISVSRWETFGRGIVEGLVAGLPTVVLENIKCLRHFIDNNSGLLYAPNLDSMASIIKRLCIDTNYYRNQSANALKLKDVFSIKNQEKLLLQILLT